MNHLPVQLSALMARRPLVLLGAGSQIRGDDGWAFVLINQLKNRHSSDVFIFWGETAPENYIPSILKVSPAQVIIFDAGLINATPGTIRIFTPDDLIEDDIYFTHRMSLSALAGDIRKNAGCPVNIILMQPENLEFSMKITPPVEKATRQLTEIILPLISR